MDAATDEFVSARDRDALAKFSVEDFVAYFTGTDLPHLTAAMRHLAKLDNMQGMDDAGREIGRRIKEAAQIIASTNPLNAMRMKSMGLGPEEPEEHVATD